jgi:transcriptional regulator with XRE-family HTH domain
LLAQNLARLIRASGRTQTEVADLPPRMSRPYLSQLVSGTARSYPKLELLENLAAKLRCKVEDLTGEMTDPVLYVEGYREIIDLFRDLPEPYHTQMVNAVREILRTASALTHEEPKAQNPNGSSFSDEDWSATAD